MGDAVAWFDKWLATGVSAGLSWSASPDSVDGAGRVLEMCARTLRQSAYAHWIAPLLNDGDGCS